MRRPRRREERGQFPGARGRRLGVLVVACLVLVTPLSNVLSGPAHVAQSKLIQFSVPSSARQLLVVSSPTYDPPEYLATFQSFQRTSPSSPWRPVFGSWQAEIGSGELVNVRREGDHATPTGVFSIGHTLYGNEQNPGGLHEPYRHLICGDWWDEDPYSADYNKFVQVGCGSTPTFASWSEALWTETIAYPYFAVIDYNTRPTVGGPTAPGSGIFLHAWVNGPTEGCVALPLRDLLQILRWLRPTEHPYIEIGTTGEVAPIPPAAAN